MNKDVYMFMHVYIQDHRSRHECLNLGVCSPLPLKPNYGAFTYTRNEIIVEFISQLKFKKIRYYIYFAIYAMFHYVSLRHPSYILSQKHLPDKMCYQDDPISYILSVVIYITHSYVEMTNYIRQNRTGTNELLSSSGITMTSFLLMTFGIVCHWDSHVMKVNGNHVVVIHYVNDNDNSTWTGITLWIIFSF